MHTARIEVSPSARDAVRQIKRVAEASIEISETVRTWPGQRPVLADVVLTVSVTGTEDQVANVAAGLAALPSASEVHASVVAVLEVAAAAIRVCGPDPDVVRRTVAEWVNGDPITRALVEVDDEDGREAVRLRGLYLGEGAPEQMRRAVRRDWVSPVLCSWLAENAPRALHPHQQKEKS